jgi:tRNA1Val (adenine37-N6)-methyltransferase
MQNPEILPDETAGKLTAGGLIIIQKKKGYRFSIDSYLLAAFVDEPEGASAVEIGSGSGVVSILLAGVKKLCMTGIEIQVGLAGMSERSVTMNGLENKVEIINADIKNYTSKGFDSVVVNPPYRPVGSGRINPHDEKALARHEIKLTLEEMLSCAERMINDGGRFYAIYPGWRLPDMICTMRKNNIEPKKIVMIHSHQGSRASLFMVKGIKGAGAELHIEKPFYIYSNGKNYTGETQDIFASLLFPEN